MPNKNKWTTHRLFIQWSASYFIISAVALLLILLSGFRYTDVLRDNLEYTNSIELDMTRAWLDQKLKLLRNITAKESMSSDISAMQRETEYDAVVRYDLYTLTKEVATDVINYQVDDQYFLYFSAIDTIVSTSHYGDSDVFYSLDLASYGIPYETWMEILQGDYASTQVFEPVNTDGEHEYLVLVRPININNNRLSKVNAVMVMDLDELVSSSHWIDQDTLILVDRNTDRVVTTGTLAEGTADLLFDRFGNTQSSKIRSAVHYSDKEQYISLVTSEYENWDIAVVMSMHVFAREIRNIQSLIGVVAVIYLGLSIMVLYDSANKRYGRLKNMMDVLQKENPDTDGSLEDAYAYLDNNVQRLVRTNSENSDTIARQQYAILQELFYTLATSSKAAAEIGEGPLAQCGFPAGNGQYYYLLAYRLDKAVPAEDTDQNPDQIREMQWFILMNITEESLAANGLRDICLRRGNIQTYIVWSEQQDAPILESIQSAYQYCKGFLADHFWFDYAIAVSGAHTGVAGIYPAYHEIGYVYQYQQRSQSTGTVLYQDIVLDSRDTMPRFSTEAENRLALAVYNKDADAACAQIHELITGNRQNYLSEAAMQYLANKVMTAILRDVEEIIRDPEIIDCQNRVLETYWRDPELLEQILCELASSACRILQQREQRVQRDEKGLLYLDIKRYIDENYQDAGLNVNSIAEHFGRQPSFISRYFKEMSGANLTPYIHKVRLRHVKEMLDRDERLDDIVIACGFGSQRSFLRIFKQYEGVTPSQYKELHRSKGDHHDDL